MKCRAAGVFALCVWSAAAADALRFEAAAIHPHDPKLRLSTMQFGKGGELSIYGMSIRNLIWLAWYLPPERVLGGPKWLDTDRYDIQAKAPRESSIADSAQRARIQTLFADRQHLRVHRETRNESVYFLRVAKSGLRMEPDSSRSATGSILPWSLIVSELSRIIGRPVIDETGLKGAWHFEGSIYDGRWNAGCARCRGRARSGTGDFYRGAGAARIAAGCGERAGRLSGD